MTDIAALIPTPEMIEAHAEVLREQLPSVLNFHGKPVTFTIMAGIEDVSESALTAALAAWKLTMPQGLPPGPWRAVEATDGSYWQNRVWNVEAANGALIAPMLSEPIARAIASLPGLLAEIDRLKERLHDTELEALQNCGEAQRLARGWRDETAECDRLRAQLAPQTPPATESEVMPAEQPGAPRGASGETRPHDIRPPSATGAILPELPPPHIMKIARLLCYEQCRDGICFDDQRCHNPYPGEGGPFEHHVKAAIDLVYPEQTPLPLPADRIDAAAQWLAETVMRYEWAGMRDGRIEGYPAWKVGGHANARKDDYRHVVRQIVAIASPAPPLPAEIERLIERLLARPALTCDEAAAALRSLAQEAATLKLAVTNKNEACAELAQEVERLREKLDEIAMMISYIVIHGVRELQPDKGGGPQIVPVSPKELGALITRIGNVARAALTASETERAK